jgi:hypothetical protein
LEKKGVAIFQAPEICNSFRQRSQSSDLDRTALLFLLTQDVLPSRVACSTAKLSVETLRARGGLPQPLPLSPSLSSPTSARTAATLPPRPDPTASTAARALKLPGHRPHRLACLPPPKPLYTLARFGEERGERPGRWTYPTPVGS